MHAIPPVLMLNTAITNQEHKMLWATPGWLPEEIGIIIEQGQLFCYEGEDLKLHLQRGMHNITVYSLIGMAVNIDGGQAHKPHLVSVVNGKSSAPIPLETPILTLPVQLHTRSPRLPVVASGTSLTTSWSVPSTRRKHSRSTLAGSCRRCWRTRLRRPTTSWTSSGRTTSTHRFSTRISSKYHSQSAFGWCCLGNVLTPVYQPKHAA